MNLRYLGVGLLFIAAAVTFGYIAFEWEGTMTFPLLLFLVAKYSVAYAFLEIALCWRGHYEEKQQVYSAVSRAISSFGLAVSLILLVSIYEHFKFN